MRLPALAPVAAAAASPLGLGAAAAAVAVTAMCLRSKELKPTVKGQGTAWNSAVLSLCPALTAPYRLPALLNNGHVETIFAAWFRCVRCCWACRAWIA